MKSCQIIVSESVEQLTDVAGNTLNKLVQPVLNFKLPFVPSALTFHIMIITTGFDYSSLIKIGFKVYHEENGTILQQQNEVDINLGGREFTNFNLNIDARNIAIMDSGAYIIEALINGSKYTHKFFIEAEQDFRKNKV